MDVAKTLEHGKVSIEARVNHNTQLKSYDTTSQRPKRL